MLTMTILTMTMLTMTPLAVGAPYPLHISYISVTYHPVARHRRSPHATHPCDKTQAARGTPAEADQGREVRYAQRVAQRVSLFPVNRDRDKEGSHELVRKRAHVARNAGRHVLVRAAAFARFIHLWVSRGREVS